MILHFFSFSGYVTSKKHGTKSVKCDCGETKIGKLEPEISGGSIANAHEFPWAVRIERGCAVGELNF